jgi:glutamyl-tRNA synthetase
MTEIRTRIAPAPSGYIHVGVARAALYNWLLARRDSGTFVLRVEDTDHSRSTEEGYLGVLEDLRWLGLEWDEGPETGGAFGPYRQSERFDRYRAAATQLFERGHAYRCYCTPEELKERRSAAREAGRASGYDGHCRDLSESSRAAFEREGRTFALRFRVPEGRTIAFDDVVRGTLATDTAQIADFVIQRSDSSPTYVLAAGLDDALMAITHIVRGEDLVPATPRQLLIREALGITDVPVFAHLPLLVDQKGRPLSKRWGDVSVRAYRERGFLPEAMINYLALLGWSYDDRTNIFSREELIEAFTLERVARNPATFDVAKLEWLNMHYIKRMAPDDLAAALIPFCERAGFAAGGAAGFAKLRAIAPFVNERLKRLEDAPPMIRFLFEEVHPDTKAAKALEGMAPYLREVGEALAGLDQWSTAAIEEDLRRLARERELKPKQAFQPIRAAVTGTLVSPPLFESLEILGRDSTLARLAAAARK